MPELSETSIQLVVFDLGRVLIRICTGWQQACRCAGIELPATALNPQTLPSLREIVHAAEVGEFGAGVFAERVAPLLGLKPADVRALSEAYIFGPYPGAIELVEELWARGIPTACLSNTNEHHWSLLSQAGHRAQFPLHRLNHQFASHLLRLRKPDDAIYAQVEKQTGVPGRSILFFDDLEENIQAAQRRGWNAQWSDPALDDPISQIRKVLRKRSITA